MIPVREVDVVMEEDRAGKLAGGGFYNYPASGKKALWEGLSGTFKSTDQEIDLQDG